MHDCSGLFGGTREQAELVARLGCEAVSLEVPMRVDLKFGRSWGDALHSWEELTGDSAPIKPVPTATINGTTPAPTATIIPIKPAIVVPPRPALVTPPKPTTVIPINYAAAPAETPPLSTPPPLDDTEIDLADLIDCAGAAQPHDPVPAHGETKPSMRIYRDHYLLLRLRRLWRSRRLADAGRGPGIRRARCMWSRTGTARSFRDRRDARTMRSARRAR